MDLLQNPFYILGATTRDDRRRLMQLTEEQSLLSDTDQCQDARATLTNPRKRISAEVAWLPGVDQDKTDSVLKHLESPNQQLLNIVGLTSIARANLFVSGISRMSNVSKNNLVAWKLAIAQASEDLKPEDIRTILNDERRASGFSEITDLSGIAEALQNQKRYYRQVLTNVLEKRPVAARAKVLTELIEAATNNGKTKCPPLIEELIPSYESSVGESLEKKQKIIEAQDEKIRTIVDVKNPDIELEHVVNQLIHDTELEHVINQLIHAVKDWDTLAQPIQLIKKSRGERHTPSFEIAWCVRKLAVDLFNEYNKLDFSQQIINMLKEVFVEVIEVDERLTEDLEALQERETDAQVWREFEKIQALVKELKKAAASRKSDYILENLVTELLSHVKSWDTSTTIPNANDTVAITVRSIALDLCNEHNKLSLARKITSTLKNVFVDSNFCVSLEVANRLTEDYWKLDEISILKQPTGCMLQIVFSIIGIIALLLQGC